MQSFLKDSGPIPVPFQSLEWILVSLLWILVPFLQIPVPLLRIPVSPAESGPTPADSGPTPAESGPTPAESGDSFQNLVTPSGICGALKSTDRYPTWASLARDYLAIIASSVSSERAFSVAGITISKRRNRLRGDIVKALECIKCLLHHDLLFREILNMEQLELELEGLVLDEELGMFMDAVSQGDEFSWDTIFVDEMDSE
jgi:hypothetical protein